MKLLYENQCEKVTVQLIRSMLRYINYSSEKELMKAIDYLSGKEKEYLSIEINADDYEYSLVEIMPKGIDLLENKKELKDIGVNLDG